MANMHVPEMEGFIEVKPSALFATHHYEFWTFLANLGMTILVLLPVGFSLPTKFALLAASALVFWLFSF